MKKSLYNSQKQASRDIPNQRLTQKELNARLNHTRTVSISRETTWQVQTAQQTATTNTHARPHHVNIYIPYIKPQQPHSEHWWPPHTHTRAYARTHAHTSRLQWTNDLRHKHTNDRTSTRIFSWGLTLFRTGPALACSHHPTHPWRVRAIVSCFHSVRLRTRVLPPAPPPPPSQWGLVEKVKASNSGGGGKRVFNNITESHVTQPTTWLARLVFANWPSFVVWILSLFMC